MGVCKKVDSSVLAMDCHAANIARPRPNLLKGATKWK